MKWPKQIKIRGKAFARVYRPCSGRSGYRVTWLRAGERLMKSFPKYSGPQGALEFAEKLASELARNSPGALLSPPTGV